MSLHHDSFRFVADLVHRRSAILLEPGKEYLVEARLAPLARNAGCRDVDAYVRWLRLHSRELDLEAVVEALTTNETSWFRDVTPFAALRDHVVPALRAERGTLDRLRVWSAACSTGQEPYSIAITMADVEDGPELEIVATDLSAHVIEKAREASYTQLEVNRGLPVSLLIRHFEKTGGHWRVQEQVRRRVQFHRHNLLDAPPAGGPFDVVFLRNVLIYFDLATKRAVLARIRRVLRPGGFLVLGAAETTVGLDDTWVREPVTGGAVYRPLPAAPAPLLPHPRPEMAALSGLQARGATA
jgi:chemotaxis protein methyltransferase CheR